LEVAVAEPQESRARPQARSDRPVPVTIAGILMTVVGGIICAWGIVLFVSTLGGEEASAPVIGLGAVLVFGLPLTLLGIQILRLSGGARIVGIVLSGLVILGTLQGFNTGYVLTAEGELRRAFGVANVLIIVVNAFIIWALIRYRSAFRRSPNARA
jgi:hypothetical protein